MKEETILIKDLTGVKDFAKKFVELYLQEYKKVFFYGDLGAGKTTFIKFLCEFLGVKESTASPTFALIHQYPIVNAILVVHHADLYRLETTEEAYNVGLEELLYDENYLFVEWPQIVEPLVPKKMLYVQIRVDNKNTRLFTIKKS